MLITLLFNIGGTVLGWILSLFTFTASSLDVTSVFATVLGYSIYLMGPGTFVIVFGCILFWTTTNLIVSIAKFVLTIIPFI